MENEEFGYFSKTVAEKISIGKDTLRTWSLKLEAEGVEFERNQRKQRIYYEKDIRVFKNMKELMELQHPLNEVAKIIAEKIEKGLYDKAEIENHEEKTLSVLHEENALITQEKQLEKFKNEIVSEMLLKMQEQQEEIIQKAVKNAVEEEREMMFNAFESKMNDVVEKRDRVLMNSLNQSMEQKRLEIAAAREETEEKEEKTLGNLIKSLFFRQKRG